MRQGTKYSHSIRPLGEGRRTQWLSSRAETKQDLEAEQGAGCARQQEWPVQRPGGWEATCNSEEWERRGAEGLEGRARAWGSLVTT